MKRRIVAILLCVITVVGCFSGSCLAAQTVTQEQVENRLLSLVEQYESEPYVDSFNGATQCKGFADMIYDALFGVGSIGIYDPTDIYYLWNGAHTQEVGRIAPGYTLNREGVEAVKALLSQALPGDYIQMKRPSGYGHTMIVLETSDEGITVLHANWQKITVNNVSVPQISVNTFNWQSMTNYSAGISLYHYKNYIASPDNDGGNGNDTSGDTGNGEDPADQNPFTDVAQGAWYYDKVQHVYQNGLMFGTSATQFLPNGMTNRAMIVTILHRLSGDTGEYVNVFGDVPDNTWYTEALSWGYAQQIAAGYDDGTFRPNQNVTREQLAAFFYRFAKMYDGAVAADDCDLSCFTDADMISNYAVEAMKWAVDVGLFNGYNDGTLRPGNTATRAEVATILTGYWNAFRADNNASAIVDDVATEDLAVVTDDPVDISGQPEETTPVQDDIAEPMEQYVKWTARKITRQDRTRFFELVTEFYASDGVDHPIPAEYIERTFTELCRSEDYLVCYVIEQGSKPAGYALLAKTFSQEAGGLAIWLEELYLRPAFRGQGIGDEFLTWLLEQWHGQAVRWRLEVVGTHDRVKALYARHGYEPMPYDQMVLDLPK